MTYHDVLGLSESRFRDLREQFETREYRGRLYESLPGYRSDLDRGVVLIEGSVVAGYPKIPRTLVLETGVPRQFDGPLAIEEKLDGCNVRVARVGDDPPDEPLAFTRSGIVCPFTTYKTRELLPVDSFFDAHPDLLLCAEMVGPENPYTVHDYSGVDSLAFRVFDIRDRETGTPLPLRERRQRCAEYDIPQVPFHGVHTPDGATNVLPDVLADIDQTGGEGVVLKSPDVRTQLKYTTATANRTDLGYAFSLPFDYGQPFMFRRLVREGFQSVERGEGDEARRQRAHDLGEAILESMAEAIETVQSGAVVGEQHAARAPSDVIDDLLAHLEDMGLTIRVEADHVEDGERVVTFRKEARSTTDKIQSLLDGQVVQE